MGVCEMLAGQDNMHTKKEGVCWPYKIPDFLKIQLFVG